MMKGRFGLLIFFRQGEPELQGVQRVACGTGFRSGSLRMDDPPAGDHEVDFTRLYRLDHAEIVAMQDLAFEQVGDRRQVDMRMRTDVNPVTRCEFSRPGMVEKDKRADHFTLRCGQAAPDGKTAEILLVRFDDHFDRLTRPGRTFLIHGILQQIAHQRKPPVGN